MAETTEDLSFVPGDVIELVERVDESWLKGYLRGQVGIFPQAFVRIERDFPSSTSSPSQSMGTGRVCSVLSVAMVIVTKVIQVAIVTCFIICCHGDVTTATYCCHGVVVIVRCCYGNTLSWQCVVMVMCCYGDILS